MSENSELVYSTDPRKQACPLCGKFNCVCNTSSDLTVSKQTARISLDRKGRKGKSVTVIDGLVHSPEKLKDLSKTLKSHLGAGGTSKEGRIEIQGDHRKKVTEKLQSMGYKVKFVGG